MEKIGRQGSKQIFVLPGCPSAKVCVSGAGKEKKGGAAHWAGQCGGGSVGVMGNDVIPFSQ